MRATVYLVDRGVRATLRSMERLPAASTTPGLREVRGLIAFHSAPGSRSRSSDDWG
jgi:hypothetical protein